jgi:hypothetical protein
VRVGFSREALVKTLKQEEYGGTAASRAAPYQVITTAAFIRLGKGVSPTKMYPKTPLRRSLERRIKNR